MRFTKIFVLLALFSTLMSCSKDKDTSELVGAWNTTAINYEGTSKTTVQGYETTTNFEGNGFDLGLVISFEANGDYSSAGDYSVELEMETDGQTYETTWTNQGFIGNGSYSKNGNTLTITSNGETSVATIVELNAITMKLAYTSNTTSNQQGATVEQVIDGTYTFERQ